MGPRADRFTAGPSGWDADSGGPGPLAQEPRGRAPSGRGRRPAAEPNSELGGFPPLLESRQPASGGPAGSAARRDPPDPDAGVTPGAGQAALGQVALAPSHDA